MAETPTEDSIRTVRRVAALARLSITDDEAATLGAQFADILEHFRVLAELDVEGLEPMTGAEDGLRDVVREDRPGPPFPVELLLREAPEREGDFYVVPKTITGAPEARR